MKTKYMRRGFIIFLLGALFILFSPAFIDLFNIRHLYELSWFLYIDLFIMGLVVVSWLTVSIYLLIMGKGFDAKRRLGTGMIGAPFLIYFLGYLIALSGFHILLLLLPIIFFGFLIWGRIYSVKKRERVALNTIVILPILLFLLFVGMFVIMMFQPVY